MVRLASVRGRGMLKAMPMQWIIVGLATAMVVVTAGSLSKHRAWWVRGLDFPRLQFAALALMTLVLALTTLDLAQPLTWVIVLAASASALYQAWWILPFTWLFPREVRTSDAADPNSRLRFLVSNVLMSNRNAAGLLDMVKSHQPHIVLAVETDAWWERQLDTLAPTYPHALKCPLDNLYGMHLYSQLPLEDTRIQYLVERDVPSMHALVVLPDGGRIRLHCLHPAPPSPTENATSTQRDAELIIVGQSVADARVPVIVTGDLNDVAWSRTTRLFRKISGLLDPRVGRSMVNTYHAEHGWLRWPLDHLFHSRHFTLCRMQRLPRFGSDHFPILVELALQPERTAQQSGPKPDHADHETSRNTAGQENVSAGDVHAPGRSNGHDGER